MSIVSHCFSRQLLMAWYTFNILLFTDRYNMDKATSLVTHAGKMVSFHRFPSNSNPLIDSNL